MNSACTIAVVLSTIALVTFAQDATTTIVANSTLKDGSSVKGEFATEHIVGSTIFAEKLNINPAIVKSLTFAGTNGESKVELANGDKFAMTVANASFKINSLLGELAIPRANVRTISLSARKVSANGFEDGLVFYCTFDDEAAITSPVVGQPVKLELGELCPDKGKNGGALFVNPGVAGAQIAFPAGTFGNEGCVEFWANMASGKTEFTTGGDPRFFIMLDANGTEQGHFEFASNNGCGNSGLGGHFFGIRTQTHTGYSYMMPYSDIFKGENYNGWHHYAFVWTPTRLTIFLDGKELCGTTGQLNTEAVANSAITFDIPLNRRTGKSFNNKSAFYMDELKIWNFAKREFDIN